MPSCCAVFGCVSNTTIGTSVEGTVRMFSFPSVPERSKLWIDAISLPYFKPSLAKGVCHKHFQESDFVFVEEYKNKEGEICEYIHPKPVLKRTAVPSLFMDKLIENMSEKMKKITRDKIRRDLGLKQSSVLDVSGMSNRSWIFTPLFEEDQDEPGDVTVTFKQPAAKVFKVGPRENVIKDRLHHTFFQF